MAEEWPINANTANDNYFIYSLLIIIILNVNYILTKYIFKL